MAGISRSLSEPNLREHLSESSVKKPSSSSTPSREYKELRKDTMKALLEQDLGLQKDALVDTPSHEVAKKFLIKDFSRWELASEGKSGVIGFFKTIGAFVFYGSSLVKKAKENQNFLREAPVELTEAVKLLGHLREHNVTLDFNEFRVENSDKGRSVEEQTTEQLVNQAKGNVAYFKGLITGKEEAIQRGAVSFESQAQAMEKLEKALTEVLQRADSFDMQRMMVAAITQNIAQRAGIEHGSIEADVLVDQMSSLWIKTKAEDSDTPLAVQLLGEKLANNLKTEDLGATFYEVKRYGEIFARAEATDLHIDGDINDRSLEFQTMIWDALQSTDAYTEKMKDRVRTHVDTSYDLLDLRIPTKAIAEKVTDVVRTASQTDSNMHNGECCYILDSATGFILPEEARILLHHHEGEPKEPMSMDTVYKAFDLTKGDEGAKDALKDHVTALNSVELTQAIDKDDDQVDLFSVVTADHLLGDSRVVRSAKNQYTTSNEGKTSEEGAKLKLFRIHKHQTQTFLPAIREGMAYFTDEDLPATMALEGRATPLLTVAGYNQEDKEVRIEEQRREFLKLAIFAAQGSTNNEKLKETLQKEGEIGRLLGLLSDPTQEFPEEIARLLFAESKVKALGIINPDSPDLDPIDQRHNLESQDYYKMLSISLALLDSGLEYPGSEEVGKPVKNTSFKNGSATITQAMIDFFPNKKIDAALYLITKGQFSYQTLLELCHESEELRKAAGEVTYQLNALTKDTGLRVKDSKGEFAVYEFDEEIHKVLAADLAIFQSQFDKTILDKEYNAPSHLLEFGRVERLQKRIEEEGTEKVAAELYISWNNSKATIDEVIGFEEDSLKRIIPHLEKVSRGDLEGFTWLKTEQESYKPLKKLIGMGNGPALAQRIARSGVDEAARILQKELTGDEIEAAHDTYVNALRAVQLDSSEDPSASIANLQKLVKMAGSPVENLDVDDSSPSSPLREEESSVKFPTIAEIPGLIDSMDSDPQKAAQALMGEFLPGKKAKEKDLILVATKLSLIAAGWDAEQQYAKLQELLIPEK